MLHNKEINTVESFGRSWAHIRHILIENNKNEGQDMDNTKPRFHESSLTRHAASKKSIEKTVL